MIQNKINHDADRKREKYDFFSSQNIVWVYLLCFADSDKMMVLNT